jgi:hypothetical protein
MVLVVAPHFVASIQSQLADLGFESSRIGEVVDGRGLADRVVLG